MESAEIVNFDPSRDVAKIEAKEIRVRNLETCI